MAILFNASHEGVDFKLPKVQQGECWRPILDSSTPKLVRKKFKGGQSIYVMGRAIIALELH